MQLYVKQTQENIHKYRYEKNEGKNYKMCYKIKCAVEYTIDLINNNISRNVQTGCTGYIHSSNTDDGE